MSISSGLGPQRCPEKLRPALSSIFFKHFKSGISSNCVSIRIAALKKSDCSVMCMGFVLYNWDVLSTWGMSPGIPQRRADIHSYRYEHSNERTRISDARISFTPNCNIFTLSPRLLPRAITAWCQALDTSFSARDCTLRNAVEMAILHACARMKVDNIVARICLRTLSSNPVFEPSSRRVRRGGTQSRNILRVGN